MWVIPMSKAERRAVREYPDDGRKVWAEVYPDSDVMVELGGIDCDEELYLMGDEAEALRNTLNELLDHSENDTKPEGSENGD
jgi:hypothetical protein